MSDSNALWDADLRDSIIIDLGRRKVPNDKVLKRCVAALEGTKRSLIRPALAKIFDKLGWPNKLVARSFNERIEFRDCLLSEVRVYHRGPASMGIAAVTVIAEDVLFACDVSKKEGRYRLLAFLMREEAIEREADSRERETGQKSYRDVEESLRKGAIWERARKHPGKLRLIRSRRVRRLDSVIQIADSPPTAPVVQEHLPKFAPWATFQPTKLSFCETSPDLLGQPFEPGIPPPNPSNNAKSVLSKHTPPRKSKTPTSSPQPSRIQKPIHGRSTKAPKSARRLEAARDCILQEVSNWAPHMDALIRPSYLEPSGYCFAGPQYLC